MKKSKLLILLPLIALSMSSCDMTLTAGQSGSNNRSSSSEEVNEPSSYSSYLVEYGFYYDGNLESVPEGASLYLYGSLVRDSFTPLTVNEAGYYQTTISDIEYGTYEYSLYIEYTDKDVSLESPLVYSGLETVNGNSSSGGNKYIYLDSSLSELLGEEQGEGSGEDITYTYTIEVDNSEALTTLTYDGNAQTQTSVDLQVYLVTTGSDGSSTREEASADDVSISTTGYDVISVSGLTVTVVGAGNTTLTISATDYTPTTINVIVTDITDSGSGGDTGDTGGEQTTTINNYTIIFTLYDSSNTVQTCPENGSLYIQSNFGGEWTEDVDGNGWYTWGNWETLTESKTAENTTYSITVNNVIPGVYYECNIIFVPTGDSAANDWANLVQADGQNIGVTISSTATDGGSQNVSVTGCYNLEEQYGSISGTTDGGKPDATYIHNFTLVVTIYGSDGTTVKKAPSGYDLYIAGDMDGKWTETDEGSWYSWGDLVKLEETTDENGNLAYTYTFGYVEANSSPSFNIYYIATGSEVNWDNKLGSENFYFNVDSSATDDYTQYVTCSINSDLDDFMENAVDTGDTGTGGDDPSQGGDTGGNEGSLNDDGTATVTLNIIMYAPDGSTSLSVPSGCTVYIAGSFDVHDDSDGFWWNLDENSAITLTSSDNNTYLYTYTTNVTPGSTYEFKLLLVEDNAAYDWYNYTIYDSTFTVPSGTYNGDSIDLKCTTTYTDLSDAFNTTGGDTGDTGDVYTGDGTLTNDKATINLRITITNPSGNSLEIPSGYTVYIAGDFDLYEGGSTWNVDSTHALTLYSSDNGEYVYTYSASVTPGTTYNYSLLFVDNNGSADWWTYVIASSTFSVPDTYTNGGILEITSSTQYDDLNNVITSSGTGDEDPSQGGDTGTTNSCTLSVSFTDASTGNQTLEIPYGYTVYLAGTFNVTGNSWNTDVNCYLTRDTTQADKYVYTYEFDSLAEGQYTVEFLFCETGTVNWDHSLGQETFSVGSDGTITPSSITHKTSYDSLSDVIKPAGEDTTVYILILDTTSTAASSVNTTAVWNSENGIFNGSDTCASTVTTAGNGVSCVYNSVPATIKANTSAWFTLANIDSTINWTDQIGTNTIEIPEVTTGNIAVYVCQSELNRLGVYTGSWDSYAVSNGEWITSYSDLSYVISNISTIYNH